MTPNAHKTETQQNTQPNLDALPESLRRWCLSGKSVQDMAHLVKNALQITSGCAEIIELGLKRKQFDRVERSWELFEPNFLRLKKCMLDLIKYTKQYALQKSECCMNSIAANAIRSGESILKNKSVSIDLQHDPMMPALILDADRIEETIANLITHAADNLPDHTGTITVTTQYLKDHHQVQISVSDSGPLLTNEIIKTLAEPAERTHSMIGTGFDIPLAKLYIEQHDGYLEFENTTNNCVHAYLPIQ